MSLTLNGPAEFLRGENEILSKRVTYCRSPLGPSGLGRSLGVCVGYYLVYELYRRGETRYVGGVHLGDAEL